MKSRSSSSAKEGINAPCHLCTSASMCRLNLVCMAAANGDLDCEQCGGEGYIALSEAGPSEWGEDTFCEVDRDIKCPTCKGRGIVE